MICVNECSFLKKEDNSDIWYCSLYNKNLSSNHNTIACDECYREELKTLKDQLSSLYKIEDIIKRL